MKDRRGDNSMLHRGALFASVVLIALGGCARQAPESGDAATGAEAAVSQVERGPVQVRVEVSPRTARLSDEPTMTVTICHREGVSVTKPVFAEALGDFVIRDFREPLPTTDGPWQVLTQVLTLEPTRTGELSIWPLTVTFTQDDAGGEPKEYTLETEGLTVEIASVLESDVPSLDDLKPMAGPVPLPAERGATAMWLLGSLAVLALLGLGAWWWLRRKRAAEQAIELSPQELAWLELQRIVEQDLAAVDVKRFYVELTGVVRRYIERTTGVLAAEQTTEEFLHQIAADSPFSPEETERLTDFLESADLVKFAAHQPRAEDIESSFQRAQRFVGLDLAARGEEVAG